MQLTVRDFNFLREELCGVNPDFRLRPLTKYFGMKVERIQEMLKLESHIAPESFTKLLTLIKPEDIPALHQTLDDFLEKIPTMRKNKPDLETMKKAVAYLKENAGKFLEGEIKMQLKQQTPKPAVVEERPSLPVPSKAAEMLAKYKADRKPEPEKVEAPAPAPENLGRGMKVEVVNFIEDFPILVDLSRLRKGQIVISVFTQNTPAPKPGDGRVVIPQAARKDIPSKIDAEVK